MNLICSIIGHNRKEGFECARCGQRSEWFYSHGIEVKYPVIIGGEETCQMKSYGWRKIQQEDK